MTKSNATIFITLSVEILTSAIISNPSATKLTTTFTIKANRVHVTVTKIRRTSIFFECSNPIHQITLMAITSKSKPTTLCIAKNEISLKVITISMFLFWAKSPETAYNL